jgi:dienelactone hydrolase
MKKALPVCLAFLLAAGAPRPAAAGERLDLAVRGHTLGLTLYRPAGAPKGTILMGSGDVGWVGLAASLAGELAGEGYTVVGLNVRQYLASFTQGKEHLRAEEVGPDFHALVDLLAREHLLTRPVVASGVSEGAALAVLAAADPRNHSTIDGVITMGLPPTAELAWRWSDATTWITKADASEPSFAPREFIGAVSPVPIVMIQSKRDEYVPESEFQRFLDAAKEPKKLVLIDASNHRFTDRLPELRAAYRDALAWVACHPPAAGARQ